MSQHSPLLRCVCAFAASVVLAAAPRGQQSSTTGDYPILTATRLVACARAAFRAGLAVARAGTRVNEIRGLSGHGVGRTIHEEPSIPNDYNRLQDDVLTDALVVTIEPMIAAGSGEPVEDRDGWTIRTRDGSLAAHHEPTIMIARGAPVVLTAA